MITIRPITANDPYLASKLWNVVRDRDVFVQLNTANPVWLLEQPKAAPVEILNDTNSLLVNCLRALRTDARSLIPYLLCPVSDTEYQARVNACLAWNADALKTDPTYYDVCIAGWWLWLHPLTTKMTFHKNTVPSLRAMQSHFIDYEADEIALYLQHVYQRFQRVRITDRPWLELAHEIVKTYNRKHVGVLFDARYASIDDQTVFKTQAEHMPWLTVVIASYKTTIFTDWRGIYGTQHVGLYVHT